MSDAIASVIVASAQSVAKVFVIGGIGYGAVKGKLVGMQFAMDQCDNFRTLTSPYHFHGPSQGSLSTQISGQSGCTFHLSRLDHSLDLQYHCRRRQSPICWKLLVLDCGRMGGAGRVVLCCNTIAVLCFRFE